MDLCPLNRFFSPAQRARYAEALTRRYSCRCFAAAPDGAALAALNYAAVRVCLPGTRIVIADCPKQLFFPVPVVGGIKGAEKVAYVIAAREQADGLLLCGISGEAFVLEAEAMGVGTCWVSGSYRRRAVSVALAPQERVAAVIALGQASSEHKPIQKRKSLSDICRTPPASWPLWAYHAAEAVRRAPSALNLQPWRLSYGQQTLRLLGKKRNTLDMGIAMLHMDAAVQGSRHWQWGEGKCIAHMTVEDETP